jgi:hypothetical protein
MGPKLETLAFRIWQIADPVGWDITVQALADELEVSKRDIKAVLNRKGWANRVRADRRDTSLVLRDDKEVGLWD